MRIMDSARSSLASRERMGLGAQIIPTCMEMGFHQKITPAAESPQHSTFEISTNKAWRYELLWDRVSLLARVILLEVKGWEVVVWSLVSSGEMRQDRRPKNPIKSSLEGQLFSPRRHRCVDFLAGRHSRQECTLLLLSSCGSALLILMRC